MKKRFTFIQKLSAFNTTAVAVSFVAGFTLDYFGLLGHVISLAIWQLLLIIVAPNVFYMLFRLWWLRGKRLYKPTALVSVIADERKFMLIRYHNHKPLYAVCKEVNRDGIICLHQKYIEPWQEKETDPFRMNIYKNINRAVPVGTLKEL